MANTGPWAGTATPASSLSPAATTTGLGKYTSERVNYCNGLINDGDGNNDGAYPTFVGVPDMCNRFFADVREAVRPPARRRRTVER